MLLAEYAQGNYDDTDVTLTSSGADQQLGQGFLVYRDGVAGRVNLYMTLTGAPGGYLYLEIQTDDSGVPSGTAVSSGTSEAVHSSNISSGMNAFDFNADARAALVANTQYHIVVRASGYTADASNYITIGGDQTTPHYMNGVGTTYDGADWTAVSTATDFVFQVYSDSRTTLYSNIREVEALTRHLTDSGRYDSGSKPTAQDVMDFETSVAQMIDGWLAGAGIDTPLSSDVSKGLIRQYANACVAMDCELTARTSGYTTEESSTRTGSFRRICEDLHKDLANDGNISDAIKEEEGGVTISGAEGLTAGVISATERDEYADDSDIIQPDFKRGMFDNG